MLLVAVLIVWSLGSAVASAQSPGAVVLSDQDLIDAAKLGRVDIGRMALEQKRAVDVQDARAFTPLLWASSAGYVDMVRVLLEAGANVNHRARDGSTALLLASANGFDEVVRQLVVAGANMTVEWDGLTARALAERRGHAAVVNRFSQIDELSKRLQQAVSEGHDSLVRQLVAQGAPVDVPDAQGVTPMMMAARNGDLGILQHLVSRGASLSTRDAEGRTILDWANRAPLTAAYVAAFVRDRTGRPAPVAAAPQPASLAAPSVATSLRALAASMSRIQPTTAPLRRVHRATTATLDRLLALSANWPAESPADYRASLAALVVQLDAAIARGEPTVLADSLQALGDDLDAKLEHCIQSGGALGGSIDVNVRTLRAGTEVTSWQIFYIPKMLEASASASPDLFPQLSSPARDRLVPGRYVMWVRDPATARTGERTVVKIGEGRKELAVELPVPAVAP